MIATGSILSPCSFRLARHTCVVSVSVNHPPPLPPPPPPPPPSPIQSPKRYEAWLCIIVKPVHHHLPLLLLLLFSLAATLHYPTLTSLLSIHSFHLHLTIQPSPLRSSHPSSTSPHLTSHSPPPLSPTSFLLDSLTTTFCRLLTLSSLSLDIPSHGAIS